METDGRESGSQGVARRRVCGFAGPVRKSSSFSLLDVSDDESKAVWMGGIRKSYSYHPCNASNASMESAAEALQLPKLSMKSGYRVIPTIHPQSRLCSAPRCEI